MKWLFPFFFATMAFSQSIDLEPFKADPVWDYQTIVVNGQVVHKSRNWSGGFPVIFDRYAAIRPVLDRYTRPFKVLDIGANNGFFSLKIAEDYESVAVMVDRHERLTKICEYNTDRKNVIYLRQSLRIEDLRELAEREHFDVILAFHVLHHQKTWREWIDVLFELGDNVIIEMPSVRDKVNRLERTKEITRYVLSLPGGVQIGSFSRKGVPDHMIWFCQNPENFHNPTERLGISPETFFRFNGAFPPPFQVSTLLNTSMDLRGSASFGL